MRGIASPFIFDGPVPPQEVVGRDAELSALHNRAQAGRFVALYAPRRYGKTSLIGKLRADAIRDRDMTVVVADMEGCQSIEDLNRRLAASYEELPRTAIGKALHAGASAIRALNPSLPTPIGQVSFSTPHEGAKSLERLLALPQEAGQKAKMRVLVVFDEFQTIATIANADAIIRSQIQHQRDVVSYLFAGSERHLLQALFSNQARPLYGQAEQFHLRPFSPEVAAEFVTRKFEETDRSAGRALQLLVTVAAGHPQRLSFLADYLWHATPAGGMATEVHWQTALDGALHASLAEFEALNSGLTVPQKKVARMLAWGQSPVGAAAQRLGLSKGSAGKALETLIDRSIVIPHDGAIPAHLVDPLLGVWIRTRQPMA